jgi:ZIP family zinc transporter
MPTLEFLPIWAQAAVWGAMAGSGLLLGLLAAKILRPGHGAIARVMSFGAGGLLATASIELTVSAQLRAGTASATTCLLIGALLFSFVNAWLARRGAKNRKRCGECVAQENERERPGSGQVIAIGTIIDAIPEGLVLGIAVAHSTVPTIAIMAGFFLANIPESLSGSAGMYRAGRSMRYIYSVWATAGLVTPVAAVLGSLLLTGASPQLAGVLDALAGGVLLAMALETMIPEAFHETPLFSGTIAVLGFAILAALVVLA